MLNVIRENLRYTKWILWLVALSFVLFFGTAWWESCGVSPTGGGTWAALVNGREIPVSEWQQQARQLEDQYRRLYGEQYELVRDRIDPRQTAVRQLVQRELVLQDARRMGLDVSDEEIARTVRRLPQFQENGQFIGTDRLRSLLARGVFPPHRTEASFVRAMREELLFLKWQELLTASVVVTPREVREEFARRHERVEAAYVALDLADYEDADLEPDEATLSAWYDAHREDYVLGEARRGVYVLFDDVAVADRIEVSDEEIRAYYEANGEQFERSERRSARHVLVAVDPEADAAAVEAAREEAESLADRARAGEDFAALAREHSDDEQSRESGGDLGTFGRGRMVPEFEDSVFSLQPGEIDGPVRTTYGFHVIKLEEIQPGGMQPLEEVAEQIRAQLRFPRLREAARELAREFKSALESGAALRGEAERQGLEVRETGLVTRADSIPGLGPAPELTDALFELEEGEISEVLALPVGAVVASLVESVERYQPPLEAVRDRVLADFRRERAAAAASDALQQALRDAAGDLAKAAARLGVELRTTDPPLQRGAPLPGVGADRAVEDAAFSAQPGELVGPVAAESAVVALRITGRTEPDFGRLDAEQGEVEAAVRAPRANRLIAERVEKLRNEAEVSINLEVVSPS